MSIWAVVSRCELSAFVKNTVNRQKGSDKVYIEKLLAFIMDEFVTEMTVNKDESFEPSTSVTYNEAIQICEDFVENSEAKRSFLIADKPLVEKTIILKKETDGMARISVSMHLWS